MTTYTTQEKREDDADQAWKMYARANYHALNKHLTHGGHVSSVARQAFVAGYLEGRADGKIGD